MDSRRPGRQAAATSRLPTHNLKSVTGPKEENEPVRFTFVAGQCCDQMKPSSLALIPSYLQAEAESLNLRSLVAAQCLCDTFRQKFVDPVGSRDQSSDVDDGGSRRCAGQRQHEVDGRTNRNKYYETRA